MKKDAAPVQGLDQLISRIKAEAIEDADQRAAEILSSAEERAAQIIEDAERAAREKAVSAEKEIERDRAAATRALQRACRDAIIETRQSILNLFSKVLQSETRSVLSGESLASYISAFVARLSEASGDGEVVVRVSESEAGEVLDLLRLRLGAVTGDGLELKADPELSAGFRVGFRDGNFFVEVSPESVTELLARHLTPELNHLMKEPEAT